jgi:hypothetical protein
MNIRRIYGADDQAFDPRGWVAKSLAWEDFLERVRATRRCESTDRVAPSGEATAPIPYRVRPADPASAA